ncbi:MAG: hypothetical protein Q8O15_01705 [Rectinemataceae bacterium]|nr:hypothetical protein [Rectinemataceae bacterium]
MRIDTRLTAFALAIFIGLGGAAFALPLKDAVPSLSVEDRSALLAGETLVKSLANVEEMRFPPRGNAGNPLRALVEQFKASVYVESAFLVPGIALDAERKLRLVNALLQIETLSGVTYYSERKNGIAVLYDDVYRVQAPGSTKHLPPLVLTELLPALEISIHLRDSNFGSSWYSLGLQRLEEGLLFSLQNQRPLSFLLIRAFSSGDVRMRVVILPVDEGIYIAAICAAEPAKIASSMVDMYSAMEKRLRAVQGWVVGRIAQAESR